MPKGRTPEARKLAITAALADPKYTEAERGILETTLAGINDAIAKDLRRAEMEKERESKPTEEITPTGDTRFQVFNEVLDDPSAASGIFGAMAEIQQPPIPNRAGHDISTSIGPEVMDTKPFFYDVDDRPPRV